MARLLRLHVDLEHIDPPVWRRIAIPAEITFYQLHQVLQILFGWEDSHLHVFNVGDMTIADARFAAELQGDSVDETRVRVDDFLDRTGMRVRYEYDFGDSWLHTIRFEAAEEVEEPRLQCLGGERSSPPEDSGGPWGYQNMLEALEDPDHPEHEMYREWIGEWDPERFDLAETNEALEMLERYWHGDYEVDEWVDDGWLMGEEVADEIAGMPEIRFIPQHEELLRAVDFDAASPGTIVGDFDQLLDYVDEHEPLLTKRGAPRPSDLRKMNRRLQAPLRGDRPRPGRVYLPDVYGIFLLLRASGLTVMQWSEGRPQLVVDQEALGQWRAFSTVEQYGHLLESWLFNIQDLFDDDIFGMVEAGPWATLHMMWPLVKSGNYDTVPLQDAERFFGDLFGLPLAALAAAFGWVELRRGDDEDVLFAGIHGRPLGEAILARLWKRIQHDGQLQEQLLMGDHPVNSRGRLRGLFLPYWPGWRRSLPLPVPSFVDGTYKFSVSYDSDTWQIAIAGAAHFTDLAELVLESVELPANHLYRFLIPDRRYGGLYSVADPLVGESFTAAQVRVGEVDLVVGMRLYFHFDFHDDHYFDLKVEAVAPLNQ